MNVHPLVFVRQLLTNSVCHRVLGVAGFVLFAITLEAFVSGAGWPF